MLVLCLQWLLSSLLFTLLVNWALKDQALWYWAPAARGELIKFYALATDRQQYDVLIMGSSVSNLGIVAPAMAEELNHLLPRPKPWQVFNVSLAGGFFPTYVEVMRGLVGRHQRPEAVVWVAAVRDFNAAARRLDRQIRYFTKEPSDWVWIFRSAPRWEARLAALRSLWRGLEALWQWPAFFVFADELAEFRVRGGGNYWYPFEGRGRQLNQAFLPGPDDPLEELRNDRLKVLKRENLNDFEINPLIDYWMEQVVSEAEKKQVPLLVFLAPESEWMMSRAYTNERKQVQAYLERWSEERGFTWVDLGQPRFRPDDSAYFDGCDHLGPEGALQLTRRLTRQVLALRLAGPVRRSAQD